MTRAHLYSGSEAVRWMPTFKRFDALVVGGGPAGAACGMPSRWWSQRGGVGPRNISSAGLVPDGLRLRFADVGLSPNDYPYRFNTFETIAVHCGEFRQLNGTTLHSAL